MVVVEINFLTGYDYVDEGTLEREIGGSFKKLEIKPEKLVIYLDEVCISLFREKVKIIYL